eukprot:TRINITY_DN34719_c0_g1_i1.p1 TRINITY_DN34719_c0_g1~~TRINITY_DN34719_c0_g1_i1.p1  ORF type:complete len:104 (+),score=17.69 TRINITY_DN34719_c0_g1_i1:122-433(+)
MCIRDRGDTDPLPPPPLAAALPEFIVLLLLEPEEEWKWVAMVSNIAVASASPREKLALRSSPAGGFEEVVNPNASPVLVVVVVRSDVEGTPCLKVGEDSDWLS